MKLISVTCPNCGAKLKAVPNTKILVCDYCSCEVMVDDEVKRYRLQDAEQAGYEFEMGRQRALQDLENEKKLAVAAAVNGVCPLCGGSIVADKRYDSSTCCFCENVIGVEDAIILSECSLYENLGLYEEELAVYEKVLQSYPESPFIKGEIERLKEKLVKNTEKKDRAQNQEEENSLPDPFFRRMSRGLFGILFIALWILGIIIFGIIKDTYGTDNAGTNVVVALILLTSLYLFIRRLHDLNRSAWFSVLAVVPYINLAMLAYLIFFEGTSGPNRFGADPLEQQNAVPAQPDAIDEQSEYEDNLK